MAGAIDRGTCTSSEASAPSMSRHYLALAGVLAVSGSHSGGVSWITAFFLGCLGGGLTEAINVLDAYRASPMGVLPQHLSSRAYRYVVLPITLAIGGVWPAIYVWSHASLNVFLAVNLGLSAPVAIRAASQVTTTIAAGPTN